MKKQDKTPVLINLVSTIRDEEGEQEAPMQLFCRGELKKTASGYLIRYQESMPTEDDSEMVTSDVILSLSEHRVTMSRPGEYGTTMVFVKDQRFEGAYHTPFGDMAMAVFPTQVKCRACPMAASAVSTSVSSAFRWVSSVSLRRNSAAHSGSDKTSSG